MIRLLAYAVCLAGFVWLALESMRFTQAVTDARTRSSGMSTAGGDEARRAVNSFYVDIWLHRPSMLLPASMLLAGATMLLVLCRPTKAEPGAAPNGGPGEQIRGSGISGGPPSVT